MQWDQKASDHVSDNNSIKGFTTDEFRWLSNYYPCPVVYEGRQYLSSEAAYQAAKTLDLEDRKRFEKMGAGTSKKEGQKVVMRSDWNEVKDQVMFDIVLDKFSRNADLRLKLLATDDKYLEETNWWKDTYWGVCNGVGKNQLGHTLMAVRDMIREKIML